MVTGLFCRYLRCKERSLKNCSCTAKIVDRNFVLDGVHSHPVDHCLINKKRFNDALYTAVTSSLRDFRIIYDELCESDPIGAMEVPFVFAETVMVRWRKIICPPTPTTLVEYVQLLEMEQWHKFTNDRQLSVSAVRSGDGSTSVVYRDIDYLRTITSAPISADATFAVCPRKPKVLQLLTITIEIDDTVSISCSISYMNERVPILWALMERKTYQAYLSVLEHFSTVLAPHIQPPSFMTDLETALAAALQTVYQQAIAQGCYFHYSQALVKRAKKDHLLHRIKNSEDMQILFRKLMALPLLPAADITAAFQWIVTNTPLDIAVHFASLFEYINTYWLRNVGPEVFSVFGMECKTNNVIEAYHKVLRKRLGFHPSIWQFTEGLCRLQTVIRTSSASLVAGLPITRPSKEHHVVQQQILQRAWDLYRQELLNIPRFLACASSFLRAFNRRQLVIEPGDVNHFVVANEVNENRVRILLEENLAGIHVLRRQLENGGSEIVILPGVVFLPCVLCGKPMDTICLPCCHWIGCAECAANLRLLAGSENADIRCSVCAMVVEQLHRIIISHQ